MQCALQRYLLYVCAHAVASDREQGNVVRRLESDCSRLNPRLGALEEPRVGTGLAEPCSRTFVGTLPNMPVGRVEVAAGTSLTAFAAGFLFDGQRFDASPAEPTIPAFVAAACCVFPVAAGKVLFAFVRAAMTASP